MSRTDLPAPAGPERRWWHRIPVSLRHHWRPPALFALLLATVMGLFGSARIVPYVTGDDLYMPPVVTQDIVGTVPLFDTASVIWIR